MKKELTKKQKEQLENMKSIYSEVEKMADKAIKKSYVVSREERLVFNSLVQFINGIAKWF